MVTIHLFWIGCGCLACLLFGYAWGWNEGHWQGVMDERWRGSREPRN